MPKKKPLPLSESDLLRFDRQLRLPEVGAEGQARLKHAKVAVIGAGGLGSSALLYLAAAGIGRIGIADPDRVEIGNLHRQVIHGMSALGERKVESARRRLLENNPDTVIDRYPDGLTDANAGRIIQPYELVLDATDNLETRSLINRVCVQQAKPMIYGSALRWEGQFCVFDALHGACYQCAFTNATPDKIVSPKEAGVLGPVPGIIGLLQTLEVIKILLGKGEMMYGRLVLFDGLTGKFEEIHIPKNPKCPVCSL
jgi:adenylyltransferase/sulfurtransferase